MSQAFAWRGPRCRVMGVLNVTPDSFSDGGLYMDVDAAVARASVMAAAGADMIDVGGESTRPGSEPVGEPEQIRRVVPVIEGVVGATGLPVSVDTTRAAVAAAALDAGATVINDISAATDDPEMPALMASRAVPVVLMHRSGPSAVMQSRTDYDDVVTTVLNHLLERARALIDAGLPASRIALDPGIGFGKDDDHNRALTLALPRFAASGFAVLYGASRKSWIGRWLDRDDPADRVAGSVALAVEAARRGADWVRAHDVRETADALRVAGELVV